MATDTEVKAWLAANPKATDAQIAAAANAAGVGASQLARVSGVSESNVINRMTDVAKSTSSSSAAFDPYSSSLNPSSLAALQKLDLSGPRTESYTSGVGEGEVTLQRPIGYLPSDYGAIYSNSYGGDTGADPTPSGFFGPSEVVNGVTVRPYYDADGNLVKYVGGATKNLSDSVRLSAQWDPTGKAAPVQWNTDNGLFNSGVTFDDAVKTAIIAATGYNALGPGAGAAEVGGTAGFQGAASDAAFNQALANSGATAAGTAGAAAGATTLANSGAAGSVGSSITGATAGGILGTGVTLGQVGSALSVAGAINALTGGSITNALTGGGGNKVNTGVTGGGGNVTGGGGGKEVDISTAAGALQVADPFNQYRSTLANMYSGYLTGGNKTDITQMPGYSQFESGVLNPALEATKRAGAKSGMLMSGNEQIALQKQGQTGYYGFMTDYLNRLATASGASNNPYNAANLATGQANTQNKAAMEGFGALVTGGAALLNDGKAASNLSNLFTGGSNTGFTGSSGLDNSNIDYNYLNNIYSGGNPYEGQLSAGETWMGE